MTSLSFPAEKPQNFENHRALDPTFIVVALSLLGLTGASLYQLVTAPGLGSILQTLTLFLLVVVQLKSRLYATRVQTRIVRLEMALRLRELLDEAALRDALNRLTIHQLVALRFASDAELPGLLRQTLDKNLGSNDIKRAIKDWQGDWFRV